MLLAHDMGTRDIGRGPGRAIVSASDEWTDDIEY
jgi:hypothetical protein